MASMSDARRGLPMTSSLVENIFPTLTPVQIRRIAAHGHTRTMQRDEVLVEQGDSSVPFFVVVSGEVEIVRPSGAARSLSRSMARVNSQVRSTCCPAAELSFGCVLPRRVN